MSDWKTAWRMARFGWRREWPGMVFTLLFALYIGWIVGFTLYALLRERASFSMMHAVVDWMYLMMFPAFGLLMNRTAFAISRDDVYTRKLAHWRTMPIPPETIVKARMLNALLLVPAIGLAFLLLQYFISSTLRDQLTIMAWLAVGFIWICYALGMNAFLIWMELGCSGKRYVWLYWALMGVCMIVSAGLAFGGVHLVRGTIGEIKTGHYYWLPVSLLFAVSALYAGYRLTLQRLHLRPYNL
ncbi:hypothetical protein GE107_05590 [Cohnella sp. CFH 77786]|uniref:hypothetical protein n=1 Tax=Cohnella sp. CFH 77786 TaxID=2662265 RepID=UPI001C60D805|nr:hypothetical protein [Cohnella sp. CFH 77786]MBW5445535.1 hypothetical protein [Cohnella sp. CFH 77786]